MMKQKSDQITMSYEDTLVFFQTRDREIQKITENYESDGVSLGIDIFLPDTETYPGKRPGILFFFGGGFRVGCRECFEPQARELAKQGYVALCADYRLAHTHGTKAAESIRDGAAAWLFMREHVKEWNMDEDRLALAGGSAGGLIALMAGRVSGIKPGALVLFNPGIWYEGMEELLELPDAICGHPVFGEKQLQRNDPPMLILHGEMDVAIPSDAVRRFAKRAEELAIPVRLVIYPGMNHGFFNYNRSRAHYFMTLGETLLFLDETIGDSVVKKGNDLLVP